MINLVYIGEDDYIARLKHGDVYCSWIFSHDGSWYIIQNRMGEEITLFGYEVELLTNG